MSHFRFVPLVLALAAASLSIACTTAPTSHMGSGTSHGMGVTGTGKGTGMGSGTTSGMGSGMSSHESKAAMDGHMLHMRGMHTKMMNAKTPEERRALMNDHMKAMENGMAMMKGMTGTTTLSEMGGNTLTTMSPEMAQRHEMMMRHQEMMQVMMDMMSQRMPMASGAQ